VIRIEGLGFAYGAGGFELRVPALEVAEHAAVGLVGPSGSGKSTLLHLVAGILRPAAGVVEVAGERVDGMSDARRRAFRVTRVGLVFQELELLDYLSVLDNILLTYRLSGALRLDDAARRRARELAAEVGIERYLRARPSRLSQGERQRLALCRALVTEPALILADEPTGNLDPRNKRRVMDLLLEQCRARGATLVTVTHDHGLLDRFGRVVRIEDVLERGAPARAAAP
jgi:ABC-type lipoprotein export system ATPase subunit